jgi:hypothetical protein
MQEADLSGTGFNNSAFLVFIIDTLNPCLTISSASEVVHKRILTSLRGTVVCLWFCWVLLGSLQLYQLSLLVS